MLIINNHIVEDKFGILFCDEYFDEHDTLTETDSFDGLCPACTKRYKNQMTYAARALDVLSHANKTFFNYGSPYAIDTHRNKKHNLSHKSLDFLEAQGFIVGWYKGEFSGNPEINCRLTSKGRDFIRKHRRT